MNKKQVLLFTLCAFKSTFASNIAMNVRMADKDDNIIMNAEIITEPGKTATLKTSSSDGDGYTLTITPHN